MSTAANFVLLTIAVILAVVAETVRLGVGLLLLVGVALLLLFKGNRPKGA
jgi:hypothetical protein